jgi:ACS family hexuronate transporter-like MFS transporter
VPDPALAVTFISLAMFGHGAFAFMVLPTEVFPKQAVGSVTGLAGTMGGIMGVLTQQAIGWTVQNVSFTPVFTVCPVLYFTAFAVVCVFIGKLGEIRPLFNRG